MLLTEESGEENETYLWKDRLLGRFGNGPSGSVHRRYRRMPRLGNQRAAFPLFRHWQLVINTATTVLTFLAVFLIQNSKIAMARQFRQNSTQTLIAVRKARSEFVGIEHLSDEEVEALRPSSRRKRGSNPGSSRAIVAQAEEVAAEPKPIDGLRPTSPTQTSFPGFMIPFGSSACLIARSCAPAPGPSAPARRSSSRRCHARR